MLCVNCHKEVDIVCQDPDCQKVHGHITKDGNQICEICEQEARKERITTIWKSRHV